MRLEREQFVQPKFIMIWSILAFQAGFINAFGFLACGRYVSHVTGFGTQIGIALAEHSFWFALELLGFPLFFLLGSMTSGFFTSARMERGLNPYYDRVALLLPLCLAFLYWVGHFGGFGIFGEQLVGQRDFLLLFILSYVCGLQNACFATLTKGQIRTTHLTGILTDLGTDTSRLLFGKLRGDELRLTREINVSRLLTFLSFAVGSVISVVLSEQIGYSALLLPLGTALFVYFRLSRLGLIQVNLPFRNLIRKRA